MAASGQASPWHPVLETALDAVIVIDSKGVVVEWNASARAIFGWQREEAIGRNMAELIVPVHLRQAHHAGMARYLATGAARVIGRRIEITGVRRSGEEFPIELSISAQAEPDRLLFVAFLRDLSTGRRVESTVRASEERFATAFNAAAHPMSISTLKEGRIVDINAAALADSGLKREDMVGRTIKELGIYDDTDSPDRIRDILLKHGHFKDVEITFKRKCRARTYILSGNLVEVHGEECVLLSAVDITERKQAEQHLHLLMREMNHRANNLLAVVQAIARQTADNSDPETFVDRLSQRISSLAASNSLLVSGKWQGADMAALVTSQLSPFAGLIGTRVVLQGPPVRLKPSAAQAVGMALHELSTNAGKYGALSNNAGRVRVEWRLSGEGAARTFHVAWHESGGPPVGPPSRTGFGHTVVVRMIEDEMNGKVMLDYAPQGVRWSLTCPALPALDLS